MAAAASVFFDYDLSKAKYIEYVKKCFDEGSTHSEYKIRKTIEALKGSEKTHLHKYYETSFAFGREVLMEKRKSPTDPEVQVLTFEDVFDIFIKFHIANNHNGGRQHLMFVEKQFLKTAYNYPSVCLSLIVKSCNVCISKKLKPVKTCTKIGSVFITLMVQNEKNLHCKYLLIYIDKSTDFVVIRPISHKHDAEIAMEIFKILMQFGPPQKLCMHGLNKDFNKKVASHLRQVCPKFNFSIEYRSANLDSSAYVVSKIMDWMSVQDSPSWEIGCSVVQKELNMTRLKTRTGESNKITPFELIYGKAKTELMSEKADLYHQNAQVLEMRFKTKKVQKKSDIIPQIENPEVIVLDDDVVELRIPNTENYNLDLLSQFEDSEASQEHVEPTQTDEIKWELEEMVIDDNENNDEVMQPPKVLGLCKVIDDKVPSLDLEVDDDQPLEKEEIEPNDADEEEIEKIETDDVEDFDTRRSLRLVKKIVDSKVTEWIEEKSDEVVEEDILDVKEDPLNMNEDDDYI